MSLDSERLLEVYKKRKKQEEIEKKYTPSIISGDPLNMNKQSKNYIDGNPLDAYYGFAPLPQKIVTTAPTTNNNKKLDFFSAGAFSDGYHAGDITKTILGTAGDVGVGLFKGLSNLAEGVTDTGAYLVSDVADLFGADNLARDLRETASTSSLADDVVAPIGDWLDKYSLIGETTDSITESIGYISGVWATGGVAEGLGASPTLVTTILRGTSGFGSGRNEAYLEGSDDGDAIAHGLISSGTEVISEMLFSGMGKGVKALGFSKGLSNADDMLAKTITSNWKNKALSNFAQYGIKASAEGVEEVVSGFGHAVSKKLTYMSDEEFSELLKDENLLEQFIVGTITSAVMQTGDLYIANATGRDFISGLTTNEQSVVEKEFENRIAEQETDGKKLSAKEKNKIYDDVVSDLNKGRIGIDTIESVLGGETFKTYKDTVDSETKQIELLEKEKDFLQKEKAKLEEANNTIGNAKRYEAIEKRNAEIEKQLKDIENKSKKFDLKKQLGDEVFNIAKDSRLVESYNEKSRKSQAFEADLTQYDEKHQGTYKRAMESGILNNTNRTHEFVDMIAKLEADKGVLFDFTNNEKIKETGFAIEGKQVKGHVQGNNISINIDSTSALNKVVGHEITHVLEGTELYAELANAVKEFATAKGEYDSKLQSIAEVYEGMENVNLENELTADLIGEYLFTDPEFVYKLSIEQPTLFKKIFNEIKYLCKIATAGSKEARQLEKVKKTFEEAYRQKNNTATDDGVKYSIEKLDDGKQYVKADRQVFSGNDPKQWGKQVTDYINDTIRHGKDVVVYAQDGDALTITENTAGKAAFRNTVKQSDGSVRPMTDEEYAVKLRAESHIDEISQVSRRGNKTVPDYKNHNFAKDGFNYRTAYFMDADGKYYRLTLSVGKNGVINTVYNVGKIKEEGKYSLRGSKPVTNESVTMRSSSSNNSVPQDNTTVNNDSMQDKGKYSLSNSNDDIGPVRERNNVYGEDIKLQPASADDIAPTAEDIKNQDTLVIDDAPIKDASSSTHNDLVNQMSDIMDENYISLEEFTNSNSSVWKNVDYNDEKTKTKIMREVHQNMVNDGVVVEIADDVKETVAESYPDLRSMKKKDRTPIIKEAINKLKSNLRSFLSDFKNQSFEFEVSGKVLEAKLYNTGINEVLEKITQDKAEMLYSTREIFRNARYLYSTPDYDGDPNVYRWNYFYTPVKIGDDTVGVRIAVRDTATPQESQIYNWGIKKDTSLDGVGRGTNDRISHDVSSDVSTDIIPNDEKNVNENIPDYFVDSEDKQETKLTRKALHSNIIEDFKSAFKKEGFDLDEVLNAGKRHSALFHNDNTPQRIMEKTFGKAGKILADLTVNKIAQNETEAIKWLNSYTGKNGLFRQLSKEYHIKPYSKEDAAAHMYLEGFYVNESDEYVRYGDAELAADFPDRNVRENIRLFAKDPRVREFYDSSLNLINEGRVRNCYDPIPRRDNYALHFRAMDDFFSRLGVPLNPNDIKAKDLPTDLNGVTADLKPGQPYFASAKHRIGVKTTYSLLGGMERYANSAKNQIYHIDDIQNLRALRNYIADTFGQAKGLEGIDELTADQAKERIEQVYNGHLSNFAAWLNEEANHIAGKTALMDRAVEGLFGRRTLQVLSKLNGMVGNNQVGFNPSSSLTNIIPVVQTFARTNKYDFAKAFSQMVLNAARRFSGNDDGFAEKSPVMIRRKGAESFARTPYQKIADTGYVLMSAVDGVATELIARTKFNEYTRKGMDEQKAHIETDKWVSKLMGDRSHGQQPLLYNSKTLGLFTKYQLEVRNQLDSMFYDTIQETKEKYENIESNLEKNAKTVAKYTATLFELAVAQHIFGTAFEAMAGYNPAFDIIEVILKACGYDDEEESEDDVLDNLEQAFFELLGDMPYSSLITNGGRIPISSALPIQEVIMGKDQNGYDLSREERGLKALETLPYYFLPTGYGQLKKTVQGLSMFDDDLPIAGSYTDSGKLRFSVEETMGEMIKAGLFGQYASENARQYFDEGRSPLNEKQVQELVDVGIPIQDYWKYRDGLAKQETLEDKFEYINGLDLSDEQKNVLINNIVDRKENVDISNYGDFSSYDEFDFYSNNKEKYEFLQTNNVSYEEYSADEDTKKEYDSIYSWYKNNPEKVTVSKAVTSDVMKYKRYTNDLYDIRADKDKNGNSISGTAKKKKIDYINSLDIDYGAKLILYKSQYSSDDSYNADILNYLNSRNDLTYEEKVTILKELDFNVDSKGNVWW